MSCSFHLEGLRRFREALRNCFAVENLSLAEKSMSTTPESSVDRLIESYRGYAEAITTEVLRKLPPNIDRADLHAAADLGLVEAARSFDPSRGILFKTFAY
jgi:RNA polymerase sigma factor for flagellar operon FliA